MICISRVLYLAVAAGVLTGCGFRNPVYYIFVLPNDFTGKITVIYHPKGTDVIERSGNTVTLNVPDSGIVVTADNKSLHCLFNDEEWRYRDGRVIKRYYNRLADEYSFVGSRGSEGRGIREDDPLFKWAIWDEESKYWRLSTMNYEVVRGPRPADAQQLSSQ